MIVMLYYPWARTSHPYFSPHPLERDDDTIDSDSPSFISPLSSIPHHGDLPPSPRDLLNHLPLSCLNLDDETVSACRSISTVDAEDDSDFDDDIDAASNRMSLQGPKIKFHSRAPWETGDDTLQGEESDHSSRSGTIASKLKGKVSKADSLMRTFGKGVSIATRPSIDSTCSQASSKPSFEITVGNYSGSRGALYSSSRAVGHTGGMVHSTSTYQDASMPPSPSSDVSLNHDRSSTLPSLHPSQGRLSHEDFVHPYANPDLIASCTPAPIMISPHQATSGNISRSNSVTTVTDSISTRSAAFSVMSTETSATSLTSRELTNGNPRVNGKEISSPIPLVCSNDTNAGSIDRNTKLLSLHPPPRGFSIASRNDPLHPPAVTLISLQEAQARERSRSATVHTRVAPLSKARGSAPQVPFPDTDDVTSTAEGQHKEMITSGVSARARARSISAGARAKNTLHTVVGGSQPHKPERRGSEHVISPSESVPSGRILKHKKSGFMRLFSGRGVDGEKERSPPPPVPPLSNAYAERQIQGTGKASNFTLTRVPVPSFSPSLLGAAASSTTLTSRNSTSFDDDASDGQTASSRKRQPPLYIVTGASGPCSHTSTVEAGLLSRGALTSSLDLAPPVSLSHNPSQSAPPGTTDFQGLKLRPISTNFSSHFSDIVANPEEELQSDLYTPSSTASSGTALSPITPISTRRSDDEPRTSETSGERSLIIKALQDQFISAKKAWQREVRELESQVRDLKAEVEDLRQTGDMGYCEVCGRGDPQKCGIALGDETQMQKLGVVDRPRARTGDAARFASGN
ncbi:hypothetical protein PAXRUDRAFT_27445 [Paxillus rubicundulus Ve08.2h10]|uniref:Uncharacterized protein n=1 Tax=Paxillus rubicundulus Ve08.2h10 TaxID=930991 RepID=A0A0D0DWB5_9AGAM|nr:hypothetical protein PAXRUDRAFT_27445 [Paxillus rubicundulus Ve08.2h10]